jgi:hypothetical protein
LDKIDQPRGAQIKAAISSVENVIAIITSSMTSDSSLLRELNYARREGVRVLPVAGELFLDKLPQWLRKYSFFELTRDWGALLQQLRVPYRRIRVPFIAPQLPQLYVNRPDLVEVAYERLLSTQGEK